MSTHKYQKFLKQFRTKRFKKGEIILVQGEVSDCGYVVKNGVVKAYNLTSQGEEKPIGFDIENDAFPLAWMYGVSKRVQFYYEAFTDVELYCVPLDDYFKYFKSNPDDTMMELTKFVSRYMCVQLRINALTQSKATLKVINTIHFLCLLYGEDVRKNTIRIQLPLTQQDFANFIGLTRETTGIELKKLHKQGVLSYKRQSYLVRRDKLNDLIDEDYDFGITINKEKNPPRWWADFSRD